MHSTCQKPAAATTEGPRIKRIAICADDFGMNHGIDDGILELSGMGRLSAVSCLGQGPTLMANAKALKSLPVDIGLHLNFSEPIGDNPQQRPLPRLIVECYLRRLQKAALVAGIETQLDAFEQAFGCAPDFIDGHQHVHQLPVIRDGLVDVINRRYPGRPLWLRSTSPCPVPASCRLKARIIAALGAGAMQQLAQGNGIRMNRRLLGVYDFRAGPELYREYLAAWFREARDGDLLMCHPAKTAGTDDVIGPQRCREFAVFSDMTFQDLLDGESVLVSRFSQCV